MPNQSSPLLVMTDRYIKSFDFSPWGGIEGFLEASKQGQTGGSLAAAVMPHVAWLARAVNMTSVAVSGLPFSIVDESGKELDTSTDWQNNLGGMKNPRRLFKLLAASLCGGRAYVIPEKTERLIINLQYVAPHTILEYLTHDGLQYFNRASDLGIAEKLEPEEIIYFWLPDSHVEIGPAKTHPMGTAGAPAQLLLSMSKTLATYGERGFVPATILGAKGMPAEGERQKAEAWWNKFLRGWTTTVAKIFNAETMTVNRIGAGMEELKGVYVEIQRQAIEDIGAAFGIPAGLFMSDQAYATEMDNLTRQWYETSEFTSIYQCIEETFNDQLLDERGAALKFRPESLPAFQTDDKTKMERWSILTGKGVKNSVAAKIVGMDLPEGIKPEALDPEQKPEPMNPVDEQGNPAVAENEQPKRKPEARPFKANETSAMIALRIPDVVRSAIKETYSFVDDETLNDLHITLVYLGDNRTLDKMDIIRAVSDLGMFQSPIKGKLQGLARFVSGGEKDPIVCTFDSRQMPGLYSMVCGVLDNYHIPYHRDYGFIPHMTLAYVGKNDDLPIETIEPIEINFSEVYYVDGSVWYPVDLVGSENKTNKASTNQQPLSPAEIKDLKTWHDMSLRFFRKSKGVALDFECKALPDTVADGIRSRLAVAMTEAEIDKAFEIEPVAVPNDAAIVLEGIRLALTGAK